MATQHPTILGFPTGVRSGSGGFTAPLPEPVWSGQLAGGAISRAQGATTSITGNVDIPSTFSVEPGFSLPAGFTLVPVSTTSVRVDVDPSVVPGQVSFKLRATRLP